MASSKDELAGKPKGRPGRKPKVATLPGLPDAGSGQASDPVAVVAKAVKPRAKAAAAKAAIAKPMTTKPLSAETKPADAATAAPAIAKRPVGRPRKAAAAPVALDTPVAPVSAAPAEPVAEPTAPIATEEPAPALASADAMPVQDTVNKSQEFVNMMTTEEMTSPAAGFQTAMADMTAKSKAAYEKSQSLMADATEFTKGNVEAMVASGKILASGMQELGRTLIADSKFEFEALTAEVKEMASVKSPTDFFQLQSAMMRKYFDKSVAAASKNTEAMLKLANDAAQPLSSRVSLAMEKMKAA